jgi:hypothetical protein
MNSSRYRVVTAFEDVGDQEPRESTEEEQNDHIRGGMMHMTASSRRT